MIKTTNIQKILTCLSFGVIILFMSSEPAYAADNGVNVEVGQETEDGSKSNPDGQEVLALLAQQQMAAQTDTQPDETLLSSTYESMPTVADMDNPANEKRYGQVEGTDQWNDVILSHCIDRGIDPIFVKAIMAVESGGQIDAKNGSYLGLYQVGKSFGYDSDLMLSDVDYQTEAAIDVIESKIMTAYDLGLPANIYYVAKFYNGSSSYAKTVSRIYEDLNGVDGSAQTNLVKTF